MRTGRARRILEPGTADPRVAAALAVAGVDPDDLGILIDYVLDLGGSEDEIVVALRRLGIGPLALDVAIRSPGPLLRLDAFADQSGLDVGLVRRIWRAF